MIITVDLIQNVLDPNTSRCSNGLQLVTIMNDVHTVSLVHTEDQTLVIIIVGPKT